MITFSVAELFDMYVCMYVCDIHENTYVLPTNTICFILSFPLTCEKNENLTRIFSNLFALSLYFFLFVLTCVLCFLLLLLCLLNQLPVSGALRATLLALC